MQIRQDDHVEDPIVITSHLAYFFLPLPDPLGVPDKYTFQTLESTPLDRIQEEELHPLCVGASLCFHRVELPIADKTELTVLFDLAANSLPHEANKSATSHVRNSHDDPGARAPQSRQTTVVEMAIAVDLADADELTPEEQSDLHFRDALTDAFDRGFEYVRQFQRAYYLVRREPIRLVTRETLPFAVPFGIRRLFDDEGLPLPFEVPLSIYLLNINVPNLEGGSWDESDSDTLRTAISHQAENGPFASYLDLVRESHVALRRDGAYRSAVLFTATACEALFDDLLAHMMWEEGKRPEDAANVFDSQLTPRVKSRFHERLGGSWNLEGEGPIRDWSILVARLRNRVVHGGYEPTLEEAILALDASEALEGHLGDLVADKASKYPRTAVVLPGRYGLERRGKWSSALKKLVDDPSEVHWRQTFARWRLAMQRARKDSPLAEVPSTEDAYVYVVVRTDGSEQWVVHDSRAGMAVLVAAEDVGGVTPEQWANLRDLTAFLAEESDRVDVSVHLADVEITSSPTDPWLPEYRLVPLAGVMVNGQDLNPVRI